MSNRGCCYPKVTRVTTNDTAHYRAHAGGVVGHSAEGFRRALCFWDGKSLRLQSRNKRDITRRYPERHGLVKVLPRSGAVLDGEIIALDAKCRPSFNLLQYRMDAEGAATIARLSTTIPVWYVVFDVLWFRGRSVMDPPLRRSQEDPRRAEAGRPGVAASPAQVDHGSAMLNVAKRNGLEGVVAKRLDSRYLPGLRAELAQGEGSLRPGIRHRGLGSGKGREP